MITRALLTFAICVLWINPTHSASKQSPTTIRKKVEMLPPPQERVALPYTQSLAQLYYVLKTWISISNDDGKILSTEEYNQLKLCLEAMDKAHTIQEKWAAIEPTIEIFFKINNSIPFSAVKLKKEFQNKIHEIAHKLIPILKEEIDHNGYYVAYRGGGAFHGFLIDLFSEFLSLAKTEKISAYRVDLDSFESNIKDFYNRIFAGTQAEKDKGMTHKFTNYGEMTDHAKGHTRYKEVNKISRDDLKKMYASVPRAGFGAYGSSFSSSILDTSFGESALSFWGHNVYESDFLIKDILFDIMKVDAENKEKFKQMQDKALNLANKKGGVLIQYIIHPKIIDHVAWTSLAGGTKGIYSDVSQQKIVTKISDLWNLIQSNPLVLKTITTYESEQWDDDKLQRPYEYDDSENNQLFVNLQMRLYFGNSLLADPRYSKILKYWEKDISSGEEEEYQAIVKEMATLLLQYYREHPPEFDTTLVNKNIEQLTDRYLNYIGKGT